MFKSKKKQKQELIETIHELDFKDFALPIKMDFKYDYFESSSGVFQTVIVVKSFPKTTNQQSILKRLSGLSGVSFHFEYNHLTIDKFATLIDKTIQNESDNTKNTTAEKTKQIVNVASRQNILEEIYTQNQKTYRGTLLVKISGSSVQKLKKNVNEVIQFLRSVSTTADKLLYNQRNAWLSTMPFNKNQISKQVEFAFTAKTLSNVHLPSYSHWKQPNGFPIGRIKNGGVMCLDLQERNQHMTSANFGILGKTGAGKSYLSKVIQLNELMNNRHLIALDPQKEYVDFIENIGGKMIDTPKMNVLEIRQQDSDLKQEMEGSETDSTDFKFHLNFLRSFFKAYASLGHDAIEDKCFEFLCIYTYAQKGITEFTDYSKLNSKDYPLLEDVYNNAIEFTKEKKSDLINRDIVWTSDQFRSVAQILETAVKGSDSIYFNVYTDTPINLDKQVILGIRLDTVSDLIDSTKSAIYMNLNNYISSLLFRDKENQFLYFWDELHKSIDKSENAENYAIKQFASMYKVARKYENSIGFATTSPQDLMLAKISDYTSTIVGQCSVLFVFNTTGLDYTALTQLIPTLNEIEKKTIPSLPLRNCLVKIGNNLSYQVEVSGVDLSKDTTDANPYLLQQALLFGKGGGR